MTKLSDTDFQHPQEYRTPTRLNIRELLTGDINRLAFVPRYSTTFLIRSENVAEHTAMVSIYCLMIARWVRKNTPLKIDLAKLLGRAAIHDLEEVRSGDVNRTYKHYDRTLHHRMNEVSEELLGESLSRVMQMDEGFVGWMLGGWREAKDNTPEGRILAFADMLQTVSFLSREWQLGNKTVIEPPVSLLHHFREMDSSNFDFLRPLVDQTWEFIQQTFGKEADNG